MYHIADEEGYVFAVSEELFNEASKKGLINSVPFVNYLGDQLDKWKELPLLTRGTSFKKIGHVNTLRRAA